LKPPNVDDILLSEINCFINLLHLHLCMFAIMCFCSLIY